MAPLPSARRADLLAILRGPEPEARLLSPIFFGRGTHEVSASFDGTAFKLLALVPDQRAIDQRMQAHLAKGRTGLYPGEANALRVPGRVIVEARTAADFAKQVELLGTPGHEPWPWP